MAVYYHREWDADNFILTVINDSFWIGEIGLYLDKETPSNYSIWIVPGTYDETYE